MTETYTLVQEGHGFKLFRLNSPHPWRVYLLEGADPQAAAMMQALYSRDPASIEKHFGEVCMRGPERFMAQFYVGYGHKSIGDCGNATVFVEGVPMCAAKAIQDHPLYSGQEASTRYLDMAAQARFNPAGTEAGQRIQDEWMEFYTGAAEPLKDSLRKRFARKDSEDEKAYEKAVKARSFDILRAFLPIGTATLASWNGNLRQFRDRLDRLRVDPDPLNRDLAGDILALLAARNASSFPLRPESSEREAWRTEAVRAHRDLAEETPWPHIGEIDVVSRLDAAILEHLLPLLATRPPREELPPDFNLVGGFSMRGFLDYGSFRDLQRHRACRVSLLTPELDYGFHPWYLEQLPDAWRARAEALIESQRRAILGLRLPPELQQYYLAMGFRTPVIVDGPLPALFYILELRTGPDVHPTLRQFMHQAVPLVRSYLPSGVALHANMAPDAWSLNRANQDIVRREAP